MENKITIQTTIGEYNDHIVIDNYVKDVENIGLWESEKIIFGKYLSKGMKILDIGCGAGRTTFNLYKSGYMNITGFDLSEAMISACQKQAEDLHMNIAFINGNACEMKLPDQTYDACIFSFNGMMTIPKRENRSKVFSEVFRVLKKNGIFIFTTHDIKNEKYLEFWSDEKSRWDSGTQDKRLHEYGDMIFIDQKSNGGVEAFVHIPTFEEIHEEIANAGFQLIEQTIRSRLCTENDMVQDNSGDCIFWVIKKE